MQKLWAITILAWGLLLSACGGGGGTASSTFATPSDFSGTWTGNSSGTAFVFSIVQTGSNFTMTRTTPSSAGITYSGAVNGNSALVTTFISGIQAATATMTLTSANSLNFTIDTCTPPPGASCGVPGTTLPLIKSGTTLQIVDTTVGTGATAAAGNTVTVNYTGWLYDAAAPNFRGTQFDSSVGKTPFTFQLGVGAVIPGWDQGVAGMKVGGVRTLIIPSSLGYGSKGAGGVIPPNATLVFNVEMLAVK